MPPSLDPTLCVSDVSKEKGFYATNSCTTLIKYTPTKQHRVNKDVSDKLQLLLRDFFDVDGSFFFIKNPLYLLVYSVHPTYYATLVHSNPTLQVHLMHPHLFTLSFICYIEI